MKPSLTLSILKENLAVSRLPANEHLPHWATRGHFFSITRTADELSVVCDEAQVPAGVKGKKGWKCFKVMGPLDFSLVGILASLTDPLAAAGISIFAVSTHDTDYLLVDKDAIEQATGALRDAGHTIV